MEVLFIMKKVLAAVLTICVVFSAGAALAQTRRQPNFPERPEFFNRPQCPCGKYSDGMRWQPSPYSNTRRPGNNHNNRMIFAPDMPQEIREKVVEVAKLRIDLDAALSEKPINKAKATEIHANIQELEKQIEAWKFEKRIEMIEATRTQHDLNRRVKPTPPAPQPEAPEDKPEI